jgi:hypothetical protein
MRKVNEKCVSKVFLSTSRSNEIVIDSGGVGQTRVKKTRNLVLVVKRLSDAHAAPFDISGLIKLVQNSNKLSKLTVPYHYDMITMRGDNHGLRLSF